MSDDATNQIIKDRTELDCTNQPFPLQVVDLYAAEFGKERALGFADALRCFHHQLETILYSGKTQSIKASPAKIKSGVVVLFNHMSSVITEQERTSVSAIKTSPDSLDQK